MKHIPRKRFGQHFLVDKALIGDIVDDINPQNGELLIEIGPGLGAITHPILARVKRLTVVELDRDLAKTWRTNPQVNVVESDVLRVSFDLKQNPLLVSGFIGFDAIQIESIAAADLPQLRVVGNLPYNISTPILFHLMAFAPLIKDQHFMLQREVIERMVAQPSTAAYGRLSVALQWRYEMTRLQDVPPESFDPPPRVQSAMIRMVPRAEPAPLDAKVLEDIARVAFSQRRKLLRHTLGQWIAARAGANGFAPDAPDAFSAGFNCQRRAEEVPVLDYVRLAQSCVDAKSPPTR